MRADEGMSSPAVTVVPQTTIVDAGRLMLERNVTALPVVDARGNVAGIVSRSDLVRNRVVADPRAHLIPIDEDRSEPPHTVAEVMTPDVVTVRPSADEAEVTHLMQQHRIKSIPVVQGQRLLGVVSVTDILRAKVREDASIAKDVQDQLLEWAGDTDAWEIEVHDGVVTIDSHLAGEKHRALRRLAETIPGVVRVRQEPSDPSPAADLRAG